MYVPFEWTKALLRIHPCETVMDEAKDLVMNLFITALFKMVKTGKNLNVEVLLNK
jgi:hypothetical protein